jgi:hypothetical protein
MARLLVPFAVSVLLGTTALTGCGEGGTPTDPAETADTDAGDADVGEPDADAGDADVGEADADVPETDGVVDTDTPEGDAADGSDVGPDIAEGCQFAVDCADDDPCTADLCEVGKCVHATLPGCGDPVAACDDKTPCAKGVCDLSSHTCVPCAVPTDCGAGAWQCVQHACVASTGCVKEKDCKPLGKVCGASGACVECNQDGDCGDGQVCGPDHLCAASKACKSNKDCDSVCDLASGQCAACGKSADCDAGQFCNAAFQCVPALCKTGACLGNVAQTCKPDGSGFTATLCDDANPCTADGCDVTTGCTYANTSEPCNDGDACTQGETCADGNCQGQQPVACDDQNPCTDDSCDLVKGCVTLPNSATCTDADACTQGEACQDGTCQGQQPVACDDLNPCTDDSCDKVKGCVALPNTVTCTDGDACTESDLCGEGVCKGQPAVCDDANPCTDDSCDKGTGCKTAANTVACDDNSACTSDDVCGAGLCAGKAIACVDDNPCTDDGCDKASGCTHANNTLACDDGTACTKDDACADGKCLGSNVICDDLNPCTDDSCDKTKGCQVVNNTAVCDDGDACTEADVCAASKCAGPTAKVCNDGNGCTDDSCDKVKGCVTAHNAATCNDNDACTTVDACAGGQCVGTSKPNCDDSNACTDDSCDKSAGCLHADNTTPCNDGSACTTVDACAGGKCVGGAAPDCDDKKDCTTDSCDQTKGCLHVNSADPCQDGDACTTGDVCIVGKCVGGSAPNCDDKNGCTTDACDPSSGCVHVNNTSVCDDGNSCSDNDVCSGGVCKGSGGPNCDDGNACTTDGCSGGICSHVNHTDPCNDGTACTKDDACKNGTCAGAVVSCDDGKVCTSDSCDKTAGCVNANNTVACDDGDACTTTDVCAGGVCKPGAAKSCNDGSVCTNDSCDKVKGCQYVNNTASCNDSSACTLNDACSGGLCVGTAVVCKDDNVCTTDGCDKSTGCVFPNNTASCDDGNKCTGSDACAGGTCKGGAAVTCNDNNGCTDNGCEPATGCKYTNNTASCNDNNSCTSVDACKDGKCVGSGGPNCDDGNSCTTDGCSSGTCSHSAAVEATSCGDGNACVATECHAGTCVTDAVKIWSKSYGTEKADVAYRYSYGGGHHLLVGQAQDLWGNSKPWLVLTDWSGTAVLNKTYSTFPTGVAALSDGGFQIAGLTPNVTVWFHRANAKGDKVWEMTYTPPQGTNAKFTVTGMLATADGGTVTFGDYACSNACSVGGFALRHNADGSVAWSQTYTETDRLWSGFESPDGSLVFAGSKYASGYTSPVLIVTKADGSPKLKKAYGSPSLSGNAWGIASVGDGYVIAGDTRSIDYATLGPQAWLLRLDAGGAIVWSKGYGGAGIESGCGVVGTPDGHVVFVGSSTIVENNSTAEHAWMVGVDPDGKQEWSRLFPGEAKLVNLARLPDGFAAGGTLVSSSKGQDFYLVKTDLWGHATCPAGGTCIDKNADVCDDQDPCTSDVCTNDGCGHSQAPDGTSCGPVNVCTQGVCGLPPGCDHVYTIPGTQISDNNCGVSNNAVLDVPDLGNALMLTVSVDVANSNLAKTIGELIDPANTKYSLWIQNVLSGQTLVTSYPDPTTPYSGPNLNNWIGKNPKGKWFLRVYDCAYYNNQKDGQFTFSVTVRTTCP